MLPPPMFGDFASGAKPHPVAHCRVIEKFDEPDRTSWASDQAVVQGHAHDLRTLPALLVHEIETIDHIEGEIVGRAKSVVLIESVVVRLQRVGHDQVASPPTSTQNGSSSPR